MYDIFNTNNLQRNKPCHSNNNEDEAYGLTKSVNVSEEYAFDRIMLTNVPAPSMLYNGTAILTKTTLSNRLSISLNISSLAISVTTEEKGGEEDGLDNMTKTDAMKKRGSGSELY